MTLIPSYGRDYKSQKAVIADFEADKDFTIASVGPDMGRQVSRKELPAGTSITLRYAKLTKATVVTT